MFVEEDRDEEVDEREMPAAKRSRIEKVVCVCLSVRLSSVV